MSEFLHLALEGTDSSDGQNMPELPEDWISGLSMKDRLEDKKNDFSEQDRTKARNRGSKAVQTYRDKMVQRWGDEMDSLLVFAGLFSTVLTAFSVESYSLLAPTAPDPVLAALTQISAQLASFSVHNPFVNSTQPAFQPSLFSSDSTSPQQWAVWLNGLWFSSLICSLSAASVAIMVKQWLHQYNSRISGNTIHTTRFRQHRYNGLVKWKMAEIIAVLPILLQIAFCLFLAGLLVLLWTLSHTVAIIASTLVGALLAFTLVTIILPTFYSNCAYVSPLSISLYSLCRIICLPIRTQICKTAYTVWLGARPESRLWRVADWLVYSYQGMPLPSVSAMDLAYIAKNSRRLDQDGFVAAYYTTGDVFLLDHASTCFSDHSIHDLHEFFTRIHDQNVAYGQWGSYPHWTRSIPLDMASDMLLVSLYHPGAGSGPSWQDLAGQYLSSCRAVRNQRRISCVLSNLTAVLYNDGKPHPVDFPLYQCVLALCKQLNVKETDIALTDVLRKRLIAAIHTVLRTHHATSRALELSECVQYLRILMFCSQPSTQPDDMAEEDTEWKPLAYAIALAEDLLIRKLRSRRFLDKNEWAICFDMDRFFRDHQHFDLEHLAKRLSKKLLDALKGAVKNLPHAEPNHGKTWKHGRLAWLKSIEEERVRQVSMRAADKDDERPGMWSSTA